MYQFFGIGWWFLFSISVCTGQWNNQPVFPVDSGFVLLGKLLESYKPNQVLDYTNARIQMYQRIYNIKDTVYCVYSRHALYLDPNDFDPIGYLAKGCSNNGINCEHTFPQSKGAETGNARSDMHHLFPARAAVNESRSNYPFGEVDDRLTQNWFYKSTSMSSKPNKDIDEYSEGYRDKFEPREDHKGNVARAIFYFITMYDLQSDRSFFEVMKKDLCDWHLKDPVDSLEWARTFQIAQFQDKKANPFVLDCSLARRTYCTTSAPCLHINGTNALDIKHAFSFNNPAAELLTLHWSDLPFDDLEINLRNMDGRVSYYQKAVPTSSQTARIDLSTLPTGIYILTLLNRTYHFSFKTKITKL